MLSFEASKKVVKGSKKGRSMSNQPEKMEIETLTSQIFFKLSPVVGIIKSRQSWKFELVTPSGFQDI